MRYRISTLLGFICALLLLVPAASATTRRATTRSGSKPRTVVAKSSTSSHSKTRRATTSRGRKTKFAKKVRGQQGIDGDRAREIQAALIQAKYMDGEPSGIFDQQTKNALTKYQKDNGWQTKVLPDSRALIKLGLGPSNHGLLNPESAATSSAHELGGEVEIPGGAPRK